MKLELTFTNGKTMTTDEDFDSELRAIDNLRLMFDHPTYGKTIAKGRVIGGKGGDYINHNADTKTA